MCICMCARTTRSLFITTVRDCYEAYVIYCFLHFLVGTLADGLPAANRYTPVLLLLLMYGTIEVYHVSKSISPNCRCIPSSRLNRGV